MTRLEKNPLEWIVFAVALVLVLATLGYLVREALTTTKAPPEIVVTLGEPRPAAGGHQVPVRVENRGHQTAEEVRVSVWLDGRDGRREAVLVIPYVPRESRRQGWVSFEGPPRPGAVRVGGVGYQMP